MWETRKMCETWKDCTGCLHMKYFLQKFSKSNSHLFFQKNICFDERPLKVLKNDFLFSLKAHFDLKIFEFLSWLFNHVEKTAWLEQEYYRGWLSSLIRNIRLISKFMTFNLFRKQLQYIYCPIFHKVKTTRQRNLIM